jgi:hypothetical protein
MGSLILFYLLGLSKSIHQIAALTQAKSQGSRVTRLVVKKLRSHLEYDLVVASKEVAISCSPPIPNQPGGPRHHLRRSDVTAVVAWAEGIRAIGKWVYDRSSFHGKS